METMYSPGPFVAEPGEVELAFENRYISPREYLRARFLQAWEENLTSLLKRAIFPLSRLERETARRKFLAEQALRQDTISRFEGGRGDELLAFGAGVAAACADPLTYIPYSGITGKAASRLGTIGIKGLAAATRPGRAVSMAGRSMMDHFLAELLFAPVIHNQLEDIGTPVGGEAWIRDRFLFGGLTAGIAGGISGAAFPFRHTNLPSGPSARRHRIRPGGLPGLSLPSAGGLLGHPQEQGEGISLEGGAPYGPYPLAAAGLGIGKALWDMERGRPVSVSAQMHQCRMLESLQPSPVWNRVEQRPFLEGSALQYAAYADFGF